MSDERLLIIGLGNPLIGDDGAGIQIVEELKKSDLPEYVDVVDGGTAGVGLIDLMSGYSRVIVVDAVRVDEGTPQKEVSLTTLHNPLSIRERDRPVLREVEGVRVGLNSDDKCSLHEMELTSVLRLMQTLGIKIPEITIVGIPAVNIVRGIGLS
ncbi:MAG: hydrogenase maturation protease [Nitrospirota bacterium]